MPTFKKVTSNASPKTEGKQDGDVKPKSKNEINFKKTTDELFTVKIRLLDDAQTPFEFGLKKTDLGQRLFELVCKNIGELIERDYFGLRFTDKHDQRQWLEVDKSVYKQLKNCRSHGMSFRVKHYPANPLQDLKQDLARYLLYLQIRRDLAQGRLLCPPSSVGPLGALVVQAEFGDAPEAGMPAGIPSPNDQLSDEPKAMQDVGLEGGDVNISGRSPVALASTNWPLDTKYLKGLKLIFNQTPKMEAEIMEAHVNLRGLAPEDAEKELLTRASQLPTYGIDPFPVVPLHKMILPPKKSPSENGDQANVSLDKKSNGQPAGNKTNAAGELVPKGTPVYLGITDAGIVTFVGLQRNQEYPWPQIHRLACDGRHFLVYLKKDLPKTSQLTFRCESKASALALWRWTVDRKCFFTLQGASEAKKLRPTSNPFSRSHTYCFSGKSQIELRASTPPSDKLPHVEFTRVCSLRRLAPTYPGIDNNLLSGRATLPGRLRPVLDLSGSEAVGEQKNALFTSDLTRLSGIPDTVIEQPNEDDTPVKADVAPTAPAAAVVVVSSNTDNASGVVDEPLIQPIRTTAEQHPVNSVDNDAHCASMDSGIEDGTDTDLYKGVTVIEEEKRHSNEFHQAVNTLDRTIQDYCEVTKHDCNHVENVEHEATSPSNGDVVRHRPTVTPNSVPCGEVEQKEKIKQLLRPAPDEDELKSTTSSTNWFGFGQITVAALALCLLLSVVVMVEMGRSGAGQPSTRQTTLWRFADSVRRNPVIWAFDNYMYGPIRGRIVGSFIAVWGLLSGQM